MKFNKRSIRYKQKKDSQYDHNYKKTIYNKKQIDYVVYHEIIKDGST